MQINQDLELLHVSQDLMDQVWLFDDHGCGKQRSVVIHQFDDAHVLYLQCFVQQVELGLNYDPKGGIARAHCRVVDHL